LFITASFTPGHSYHLSAPSSEVIIVAAFALSVTVSTVGTPFALADSYVVVQSDGSASQGQVAVQSKALAVA